jgi:hypothetical protein
MSTAAPLATAYSCVARNRLLDYLSAIHFLLAAKSTLVSQVLSSAPMALRPRPFSCQDKWSLPAPVCDLNCPKGQDSSAAATGSWRAVAFGRAYRQIAPVAGPPRVKQACWRHTVLRQINASGWRPRTPAFARSINTQAPRSPSVILRRPTAKRGTGEPGSWLFLRPSDPRRN